MSCLQANGEKVSLIPLDEIILRIWIASRSRAMACVHAAEVRDSKVVATTLKTRALAGGREKGVEAAETRISTINAEAMAIAAVEAQTKTVREGTAATRLQARVRGVAARIKATELRVCRVFIAAGDIPRVNVPEPSTIEAAVHSTNNEVSPRMLAGGFDLSEMAITAEYESKAVREGKAATRLQAFIRGVTTRTQLIMLKVSLEWLFKGLPLLLVSPEVAMFTIAHEAAVQGIASQVVPTMLTDGVDLVMMAIAAEARTKAAKEKKAATRLQALARGVMARIKVVMFLQPPLESVCKGLPLLVLPELTMFTIAHEAAAQCIAKNVVFTMLTNGVDLTVMAIAAEAQVKVVREKKAATCLQALSRGVRVRIRLMKLNFYPGNVAKKILLSMLPELIVPPIAREVAAEGVSMKEVVSDRLTDGVNLAQMANASEVEARAVRVERAAVRLQASTRENLDTVVFRDQLVARESAAIPEAAARQVEANNFPKCAGGRALSNLNELLSCRRLQEGLASSVEMKATHTAPTKESKDHLIGTSGPALPDAAVFVTGTTAGNQHTHRRSRTKAESTQNRVCRHPRERYTSMLDPTILDGVRHDKSLPASRLEELRE